MANQEDFELFLEGVEAWNNGMDARYEELDRQQKWGLISDLSDTDMGITASRRALKNEDLSIHQATHYPRVDFTRCDLRRASFKTILGHGFDFREGDFTGANLREANLTGADLTGAYLIGTDLQDAILGGATLDGARIEEANLTGTDLSGTRPWRANLFGSILPTPDLGEPNTTVVRCVADLTDICLKLREQSSDNETFRLYYRGQHRRWKLRPSVMRHGSYRREEGRMLLEMMTRRPEDFGSAKSALSQWVLAQHQGLKTRLLDVTKNPLVAMFYACEGDYPEEDGDLHILAVPSAMIRPYDSDAISVISNFAKLSRSEQNLLLGKRRGIDWHRDRYADVLTKLYHLIGQEKPHFQRRVDPRDFFRVFVVEPQQSFERLRAQSGAFLISAFHERFESNQIQRWNRSISTYKHYALTIPFGCKVRILKELKLLNITRETLFPSLAATARAITDEYSFSISRPRTGWTSAFSTTWRRAHQHLHLERPELPPDDRWSSPYVDTADVPEDSQNLSD